MAFTSSTVRSGATNRAWLRASKARLIEIESAGSGLRAAHQMPLHSGRQRV